MSNLPTTTLPPLRFATAEDLEALWNEYLKITREKGETITLAGLLIVLGLTKDQYKLLSEHPQFQDRCRKYNLSIENAWVQRLMGQGAQGATFYLKNTFKNDYKDHYDVETTHLYPTPILGSLGQDEAKIHDITPTEVKKEN